MTMATVAADAVLPQPAASQTDTCCAPSIKAWLPWQTHRDTVPAAHKPWCTPRWPTFTPEYARAAALVENAGRLTSRANVCGVLSARYGFGPHLAALEQSKSRFLWARMANRPDACTRAPQDRRPGASNGQMSHEKSAHGTGASDLQGTRRLGRRGARGDAVRANPRISPAVTALLQRPASFTVSYCRINTSPVYACSKCSYRRCISSRPRRVTLILSRNAPVQTVPAAPAGPAYIPAAPYIPWLQGHAAVLRVRHPRRQCPASARVPAQ